MKKAIRLGGSFIITLLLALIVAGYTAAAPAAPSPQTHANAPKHSFLASDDYTDKDQIKGVFLKDPEYAKMMKDFTRNGVDEFDWGWVAPDFDLHKYKTVHLIVKDDFGILNPDFIKYANTIFATVVKRLGLQVVDANAHADVEFAFHIIGYDESSHYAFVTVIKPSVELEMRIRDLRTGQDIYLARNTEHDPTPKAALTETAQDFMRMVR